MYYIIYVIIIKIVENGLYEVLVEKDYPNYYIKMIFVYVVLNY